MQSKAVGVRCLDVFQPWHSHAFQPYLTCVDSRCHSLHPLFAPTSMFHPSQSQKSSDASDLPYTGDSHQQPTSTLDTGAVTKSLSHCVLHNGTLAFYLSCMLEMSKKSNART